MGALAALLWSAVRVGGAWFIRWAGPTILQALIFFGLDFVGQKFVIAPFVAKIRGLFVGLPGVLVNALAGVGIDQAFTIVLSAYAAATLGKLILRRKAAS